MNILLLGATGRTGRLILSEVLKAGHVVTILIRDLSKIEQIANDRLTILEGSTTNREHLTNAVVGCDIVISALNVSRTSDFPWSPLRTSKTFLSETMTNLIEVSKTAKVKRVIITSAWGAGDTKPDIPFWFRWLIDHSNIGYAYRDHERQEELLRSSELGYIIVRPVGLTNRKNHKPIYVSEDNDPAPNLTISRSDVARFIVSNLDKWLDMTITIYN